MVDIAFLYSIVYEDKYFLARYVHSVETKIFNQPHHMRSIDLHVYLAHVSNQYFFATVSRIQIEIPVYS